MRIEQQSLGNAAEHVSAGRVEASTTDDDQGRVDLVRNVCDLCCGLTLQEVLVDLEPGGPPDVPRVRQRAYAVAPDLIGTLGDRVGTCRADRCPDGDLGNDAYGVEVHTEASGHLGGLLDDFVGRLGKVRRNEKRFGHCTIMADTRGRRARSSDRYCSDRVSTASNQPA